MKIKHLIAAACLSSVAAFTFAQTADAPKPAPITNNWSPSYATAPANGEAIKPYADNTRQPAQAKKARHAKAPKASKASKAAKIKHTKAKKARHAKVKKVQHLKTKKAKHGKTRKVAAASY